MRKAILSLAGLMLCVITSAQFTVAIVGGPQSNSVAPAFSLAPDSTKTSTQTKHTGLNFGFTGIAPINKKQTVFFRTGVLYSAKGAQLFQQFDTAIIDLSSGEHYVQATTNLKVKYIDIPINLLLKIPMKGKTRFLLGAGGLTSLFYTGSTDFSGYQVQRSRLDNSTTSEFVQTINKDLAVGNVENKFQPMQFSANGLIGLEFGRAFINVHYSHGLSEFYRTGAESYHHRTLGFHLGIYLGNPKPKEEHPLITDRDGDGIVDDADACPDQPGTAITRGCPDRDGDSTADKEDNCPETKGPVSNKGCPVDRDLDGVLDQDDSCPDQSGPVENKGCPYFDRDRDGVLDPEDKCPDVPGPVQYKGCPIPDTDADGVNDELDKCPTLSGPAENAGCPRVTAEIQKKVNYAAKSIQFEFKKATISPSSFKVLDEVVDILQKNGVFRIRVEGHTSGPDKESNRVLSQNRAESVRDYFISKGIAEERILARGFGSSRPISKNAHETENPIDRRVELIIY